MMPQDQHKKNSSSTGANRKLTKAQFTKMPWEEFWKRAIPIERDQVIGKPKPQ